jgi:hypothetical protein
VKERSRAVIEGGVECSPLLPWQPWLTDHAQRTGPLVPVMEGGTLVCTQRAEEELTQRFPEGDAPALSSTCDEILSRLKTTPQNRLSLFRIVASGRPSGISKSLTVRS